ncbi:PaaI family thioesterase [Sulfobacillus acidophilus]|uniref:PaaI family thioesterase n=1 Tax=Sulfobacillus acidophilus TaxID=53633 RepID=A0ABS3AVD4_9FIRM|nr:PaaI family thioesterase [Sulfobacillus acidophilus]
MQKTHEELIKFIKSKSVTTVFDVLDIAVENFDKNGVTVSIDACEKHHQHAGIVHGGIYVLLAESAASITAALNVDLNEYSVFGMEINANHIRPVVSGLVKAKANIIHKGKTTMVIGVNITNNENKLVSVSRTTLAILKK